MSSLTEHLKQPKTPLQIWGVGPLCLAGSVPGLTYCRSARSDARMRIRRGVCIHLNQRYSQWPGTSVPNHGLAAAIS